MAKAEVVFQGRAAVGNEQPRVRRGVEGPRVRRPAATPGAAVPFLGGALVVEEALAAAELIEDEGGGVHRGRRGQESGWG